MKNRVVFFTLLALLLFLVLFIKNYNVFFRIVEAAIIIYVALYVAQTQPSSEAERTDMLPEETPMDVLSMISVNVKDFFNKFIIKNDIDRLLFVTISNEKFNIDYDFGFAENDEFIFEKKVILKAYREDISIHFTDIEGYKTVICNVIKNEQGEKIGVVFLGNIKKYLILDKNELDGFLSKAQDIAKAIIKRYELETEFKKKMLEAYMREKTTEYLKFAPSKSGKKFYVMDIITPDGDSVYLFYSCFPEPEDISAVIEDIGYLKKSLSGGGTIVKTREFLRQSGSFLIDESFFAQFLPDTKLLSFQLSGELYIYRKSKNMLKYHLERGKSGTGPAEFDVLDQMQLVSGDRLLITNRELSEKELIEPAEDPSLQYVIIDVK